ncbi:MAG: HD-GYP domain-containing protein, partial [candidate division NC10 bacterium]|nr:HD-GYP domain-containing protein [candidate division NC10 bacterium]
ASARFLTAAEEVLKELLQGKEQATIGLVEGALLLEGVPVKGSAELFGSFIDRLKAREVEGLTFLHGVTSGEIQLFVETLSTDASLIKEAGGMKEVLTQKGVRHIAVVYPGEIKEAEEEVEEEIEKKQARILYQRALGVVKNIMQEARMGKVPSNEHFPPMVKTMVDGVFDHKYALIALTMIKSYDEYLFTHSINVGILSLAVGQFLGLSKEALFELGLGAFLHDLGKVNWPDDILMKPRDLSDEEWRYVKRHPVDGVKIMEKMGNTNPNALAVIKEHHIRYDRTGYPSLEPEKEPSFLSALVSIADAYDAMTTVRPYQNAMEPTKTIERMRSLSGKAFDPELLENFIRMLGVYPVGTVVRLSTGELAVVTKPNPNDSTRPMVKLLLDRAGRKLEGEVDLMEKDEATGTFKRSILLPVDPAALNIDLTPHLG